MGALELQAAAGGNPSRPNVVENALDSLEQDNEEETLADGDAPMRSGRQVFGQDAILDDVGRGRLGAALLDLERRATAALEAGDVKRAEELQNEYDQIERQLELSRNIHRLHEYSVPRTKRPESASRRR